MLNSKIVRSGRFSRSILTSVSLDCSHMRMTAYQPIGTPGNRDWRPDAMLFPRALGRVGGCHLSKKHRRISHNLRALVCPTAGLKREEFGVIQLLLRAKCLPSVRFRICLRRSFLKTLPRALIIGNPKVVQLRLGRRVTFFYNSAFTIRSGYALERVVESSSLVALGYRACSDNRHVFVVALAGIVPFLLCDFVLLPAC